MTQIFIMCQGEQRRLAHLGYPKQLIPIAGEPILARTMRLLVEKDFLAPLIIGRAAQFEHVAVTLQLRCPGFCILDGILEVLTIAKTAELERRLVFLLGDVVWSRAALHGFLADTRPVVFAGTPELHRSGGEVFAAAFDPPFDELEELLRTAPCRIADHGGVINWKIQQGGHLRRLLWQYMDAREKPGGFIERWWHPDLYYPITDWTTDIDDDGDLARLPEIEAEVRMEMGEMRCANCGAFELCDC